MDVVVDVSSQVVACYDADCRRCSRRDLVSSGGLCKVCLNWNLASGCKMGVNAVSGKTSAERRLPGMPRAVLAVRPLPVNSNCSLNASSALLASEASAESASNLELSQQQRASEVCITIGAGAEGDLQVRDGSSETTRVPSVANKRSAVVVDQASFEKMVAAFKQKVLSISIPRFNHVDCDIFTVSETRKDDVLLPPPPPKLPVRGAPKAGTKHLASGIGGGKLRQSTKRDSEAEASFMERLLAGCKLNPGIPEPMTLSFIRTIPVRPPSPPVSPCDRPLWERRRVPCPVTLQVQAAAAAA